MRLVESSSLTRQLGKNITPVLLAEKDGLSLFSAQLSLSSAYIYSRSKRWRELPTSPQDDSSYLTFRLWALWITLSISVNFFKIYFVLKVKKINLLLPDTILKLTVMHRITTNMHVTAYDAFNDNFELTCVLTSLTNTQSPSH